MLVLISLLLCSAVNSARILGVYPMPSISHQVVFQALTRELAKRGHELVVITPNPALLKDRPKDNVTEIDTGNTYQIVMNFAKKSPNTVKKRGAISDLEAMTSEQMTQSMILLSDELFNNEEVIALLRDKSQKFDLVIAEGFINAHHIFANIFNAPLIVFSSAYGLPETFEMTGAVARHPILYPHVMRNKYKNLSFLEKIKEIYNEYIFTNWLAKLEKLESDFLKSKFGAEAPTVDELKGLVSLVLLNCFPIFDNNRPVPPNVVYLGGLHLQPVKELPKDLKHYLDSSKRGVVYVSLGTNVQPSMMDKDLLNAFLDAFREIPYDILWKFDGDNLENVPKNVRIQKWFPQRDLLVHSKIKVFVTQGGLQSTDEAIDAGVPLVGIPFIADQWYNVNKYVELGIGVQLDAFTLSADDIVKGVNTVAGDDRFRQNLKKLKSIMYDTPQTPLERAVWWTEYVLRHKGAQHLKSPAANMTYAEYFMLDFVLTLIGVQSVALVILVYIIYYVIRLFKYGSVKIKRS
ncbi:UDP-glycosyltransferase [Manduca sexta]|uniref:UDP-glucuronosyltransferase n=2 Tax=Manduca sexta TaxID=7130 RepID=A0A922CZ92_MANSE|nr:UDP-glycosyltransferase [Manduca sexta]